MLDPQHQGGRLQPRLVSCRHIYLIAVCDHEKVRSVPSKNRNASDRLTWAPIFATGNLSGAVLERRGTWDNAFRSRPASRVALTTTTLRLSSVGRLVHARSSCPSETSKSRRGGLRYMLLMWRSSTATGQSWRRLVKVRLPPYFTSSTRLLPGHREHIDLLT